MEPIFLHVIGGAAGGLAGAKLNKTSDMGLFANVIVGVIGGVAGGNLLDGTLGAISGEVGVLAAFSNVFAGLFSGASVQMIAGMVKHNITA